MRGVYTMILALAACEGGRPEPSRLTAGGAHSAATREAPAAPALATRSIEEDLPASPGAWTTVGAGVTYRDLGTLAGHDVAIALGGYEVEGAWVEAWISELYRARLGARGVRHLYAVRGPDQPQYRGARLGTSALAAHVASRVSEATGTVIVAAHSSGSFVANELISKLGASPARGRIDYFNLDGARLSPRAAECIRRTFFVHAADGTRRSRNAADMIAEAQAHAGHARGIVVDARNAACAAASKWCLHSALVTTRPHENRATDGVDQRRDYTDFGDGRDVCTAWLDAATVEN